MTQVFWGGGLGDIFALEATMTDEYRKSIIRMYWATRARPYIAPLFTRLPSYPNLQDHVSLGDCNDGVVFKDIEGAYEHSMYQHLLIGSVEDWSICKKFNPAQPFNYSSFVKYKLANITQFNLPDDYIFLCPYSTMAANSTQRWRRFFDKDWDWLIGHLSDIRTYGVVVNLGDDPVPASEWLIDLSNKTSLAEAIEVIKKASGYIGIGSAFSVLAAQTMSGDRIRIAGADMPLWAFRHVYYAPQTEFNFFVPHPGATEEETREWTDRYRIEVKRSKDWIIKNNKSKNVHGWTEENCGLRF
jgi:hypothetical protein